MQPSVVRVHRLEVAACVAGALRCSVLLQCNLFPHMLVKYKEKIIRYRFFHTVNEEYISIVSI